jgi:hypothetical protein
MNVITEPTNMAKEAIKISLISLGGIAPELTRVHANMDETSPKAPTSVRMIFRIRR